MSRHVVHPSLCESVESHYSLSAKKKKVISKGFQAKSELPSPEKSLWHGKLLPARDGSSSREQSDRCKGGHENRSG